jgi:dTDP-glucose 4,6-dehydratase
MASPVIATVRPRYVTLITGVAGFIASRLALRMVQDEPHRHFVGVDVMSYCSSVRNLHPLLSYSNFEFAELDLTNTIAVMQLFDAHCIVRVIHAAAYTHVDQSFGNSILFTTNNIVGTHVLLEAVRIHRQVGADGGGDGDSDNDDATTTTGSFELFLHVSTDEVYGPTTTTNPATMLATSGSEAITAMHEATSTYNPTNPYAASKAGAECLVRAYHTSFGIPFIITRGNNVYGPAQYPEKLIPRLCMLLGRGERFPVQGDGTQIRAFLYIDDAVTAVMTVDRRGVSGETYNIASDDECTVLNIVERVVGIAGVGGGTDGHVQFVQDRCFNDHRYFINANKIRALGFVQRVSLSDGLQRTWDWYAEHGDTHWQIDEMLGALYAISDGGVACDRPSALHPKTE